jgi:uncharacterized protein (DUF1778 family)
MGRDPFSSAMATTREPSARPPTRAIRSKRLGFRLPQPAAEIIQRAAEIEQRSMTDFCVTASVAAARETVARHEQLELSKRDRDIFFDALMNPPAPSDELRHTLRAAKALIGSE